MFISNLKSCTVIHTLPCYCMDKSIVIFLSCHVFRSVTSHWNLKWVRNIFSPYLVSDKVKYLPIPKLSLAIWGTFPAKMPTKRYRYPVQVSKSYTYKILWPKTTIFRCSRYDSGNVCIHVPCKQWLDKYGNDSLIWGALSNSMSEKCLHKTHQNMIRKWFSCELMLSHCDKTWKCCQSSR